MEPALVPTNLSIVKKYKHFAVNAAHDTDSPPDGRTVFFYMGKQATCADSLMKIFGCGYVAENAEQAISSLKRISKPQDLPDVIIADATYGEQTLRGLYTFLSTHSSYAGLPFILNVSGIPQNDVNTFKSLRFVDEIVYLPEESDEKLLFKVEFLKKIKSRPKEQVRSPMVQTSTDAVVAPKSYSKRCIDIAVSLFALLVLSPVFLLIALAIKLESKGPVFYIAKRAGKGYRIFNFIKFRTMVPDADQNVDELSHLNQYQAAVKKGPLFFKVINDPRITRVGAFLRNNSLDELPQFFNVLCGDMSLVGNRPLPLFEAATFTTNEWAPRFMAPAGITGLWQIKRSNRYEMSVEERIHLDILYAHNYNLMYDLWIMAHTPSALIQKSNA